MEMSTWNHKYDQFCNAKLKHFWWCNCNFLLHKIISFHFLHRSTVTAKHYIFIEVEHIFIIVNIYNETFSVSYIDWTITISSIISCELSYEKTHPIDTEITLKFGFIWSWGLPNKENCQTSLNFCYRSDHIHIVASYTLCTSSNRQNSSKFVSFHSATTTVY